MSESGKRKRSEEENGEEESENAKGTKRGKFELQTKSNTDGVEEEKEKRVETPLYIAAQDGDKQIVQVLLDQGVHPDTPREVIFLNFVFEFCFL